MYSRKVEGNVAKANSQNLRISVKNAKPVCKAVRGLELKKAKNFLANVLKEKKSINGKYYSKTTKEVLNIIESGEKNAEFKNLDLDNVYIAHIAALEGTHMHRRRRKNKFGSKIKSAHLEIILKERGKKEGRIKETKENKEEKQKSKEGEKIEKKAKEVKKETKEKAGEEKEIEKKEQKTNEEIEKIKMEEKLDKEKRIEKTEKPVEKKEKTKETGKKGPKVKKTEKIQKENKKIEKK